VKPNFLVSLFLIVCMVYSTTAAAFLHMNAHLDLETAIEEHHHDSKHDQQHECANGADHAHHFNLHVTGDLVEHEPLPLHQADAIQFDDFDSRLVSRSDTPLIPPPNA
jgi:hypothetical protein